MSYSLSPIEAARVSAVLEDALEKLSFLSAITPDILMHRDEVAELTSGEISRLISEQRALEVRYEELVSQRSSLKGAGNKSRFKDIQTEIQSISYQLRESMKNLCRTLKENPDISENLSRMSEERETLVLLLEKTLTDLRDGHYASLVNFVEREHDTREKMRAVATKEEEVMRDVEQLTAKLKEEDEKHAAEMENKRLALNDLKEKLRKLKIDTTLTLRYARKEAAAKTESTARFYTAEESDILNQIEAIKHKMDMENAVHAEEMELLRREQEDFTKRADEWRARYAADLSAAESEVSRLTSQREAQRQQLLKLQERYDRELADLADKEEEDERTREEELLKKADDEKKHVAASQIQKVVGEMFAVISAAAAVAKEAKKAKGDKKKKK